MPGVVYGWDVPEQWRSGYATIGNFDGVHRGHRTLFERLTTAARSNGVPSLAVTFDPPPLALLRPDVLPPRLTTIGQRVELIRQAGLDGVVVLPTTWELLRLTADEFFQRVVVDRLAARGLLEGPNFFFGRDRGGTIKVLHELCAASDIALEIIAPIQIDGEWISSSAIRSALLAGDMAAAVRQLGHPYRLSGTVVTGAKRGRDLGFPTANLADVETVIPGHGVYAGRTVLEDRSYAAAVHIGPNPTFGEGASKIEVHLLDFTGDLYGQRLNVDLIDRVRGIQRFASVDELLQQLRVDVDFVRNRVSRADLENSA